MSGKITPVFIYISHTGHPIRRYHTREIDVKPDKTSIGTLLSVKRQATQQSNNMSFKALLLIGVLAVVYLKSAEAKNWALLVAGSSGYYNYRHQVCFVKNLYKVF